MPVSYTYNAARHTLDCVASGVVVISDVVAYFDAAGVDDDVAHGAIEVVYLDAVTDFRFSYQESRVIRDRVSELRKKKGVRATVLVAGTDAQYGMARMIGTQDSLADPEFPVRIIREEAELPATLEALAGGTS